MRTKLLVFTGIIGWLGGLATVAVSGSCDLECVEDDRPAVLVELVAADGSNFDPARHPTHVRFARPQLVDSADPTPSIEHARCVDDDCITWEAGSDEPGVYEVEAVVCGQRFSTMVEVPSTDDGCHAQTTHVELPITGDVCGDAMTSNPAPQEEPQDDPSMGRDMCKMFARPSVYVQTARPYDDYFTEAKVQKVWYEHEGTTAPAMCIPASSTSDDCRAWIAGFELEGEIRVFTEYCNTIVEDVVNVTKEPDGCHVQTQFMLLEVETLGCMENPSNEDPPAPPAGPTDIIYG